MKKMGLWGSNSGLTDSLFISLTANQSWRSEIRGGEMELCATRWSRRRDADMAGDSVDSGDSEISGKNRQIEMKDARRKMKKWESRRKRE